MPSVRKRSATADVARRGRANAASAPYLDALAAHFEIILPTHPGFYGSPHHRRVGSVDDLAYLYLDLIDDFGLDDLTVMGFSMGGWLALEMATKSCARLQQLVLVDAVGVKFTDRETRQFPDIFAMAQDAGGPAHVPRSGAHGAGFRRAVRGRSSPPSSPIARR